MHSPNYQLVYAACALLCALAGAVYDVVSRRIPNALTLPALLFGLVVHGSLGGWRQMVASLTGGLLCGIAFLLFHVAGGMGGGDVKLITAVGANVGLSMTGTLLLATSLAGGAMAVALALYHRRLGQTLHNLGTLAVHHRTSGLAPHPDLNLNTQGTLRLPYGLAIAAGSAMVLCREMMQR